MIVVDIDWDQLLYFRLTFFRDNPHMSMIQFDTFRFSAIMIFSTLSSDMYHSHKTTMHLSYSHKQPSSFVSFVLHLHVSRDLTSFTLSGNLRCYHLFSLWSFNRMLVEVTSLNQSNYANRSHPDCSRTMCCISLATHTDSPDIASSTYGNMPVMPTVVDTDLDFLSGENIDFDLSNPLFCAAMDRSVFASAFL